MNHNADYRIDFTGIFSESDFSFKVLPGKRKYKADTRKLINQAWQDAKLNPNLDIYNGQVISLIDIVRKNSVENQPDCVSLTVQATDYRSFYGTNVRNASIIHKRELSNAIAACAVVETVENTVFVGKRNPRLAETSGVWHVPGGTFDVVINPIAIMRKELWEELNISESDIQYAVCLGFGENLIMKKPEFLCYFHLNLSEKLLADKLIDAKDVDEHSEFVFVPMEELEDFMHIHPFAPIGKACIKQYLDYIKNRCGNPFSGN